MGELTSQFVKATFSFSGEPNMPRLETSIRRLCKTFCEQQAGATLSLGCAAEVASNTDNQTVILSCASLACGRAGATHPIFHTRDTLEAMSVAQLNGLSRSPEWS